MIGQIELRYLIRRLRESTDESTWPLYEAEVRTIDCALRAIRRQQRKYGRHKMLAEHSLAEIRAAEAQIDIAILEIVGYIRDGR